MVWLVLSLAVGTPALSIIGGFGAALTVGLKRGGLLLSLLVLPLYVPTLIFGAELARRGAEAQPTTTPLLMLAGITAGCLALLPLASAAALRVNLRLPGSLRAPQGKVTYRSCHSGTMQTPRNS